MSSEHFDVIIVGAGLSGIGAAYRLQERCPTRIDDGTLHFAKSAPQASSALNEDAETVPSAAQ